MNGEKVVTSIYEPITVVIDGAEYKARKRTRAVMHQLDELDGKGGAASDYPFEVVKLLVDAPAEAIDGLDIVQASRLVSELMRSGRPTAEETGKNPESPGAAAAA